MKRVIIIASHHQLAAGFKDTLVFVCGECASRVQVITAYVDDEPIEQKVTNLISNNPAIEYVILTDMMAGSVNQQFVKFMNRPHFHLITGINLPLALAFVLEPDDDYLEVNRVQQIVMEAQKALTYVNTVEPELDENDE